MKDVILLGLKAIDFKGTDFVISPCAIEKAVIRQLGGNVLELIDELIISDETYSHERYNLKTFETDKALASMLTDEEIVRVITLTKV